MSMRRLQMDGWETLRLLTEFTDVHVEVFIVTMRFKCRKKQENELSFLCLRLTATISIFVAKKSVCGIRDGLGTRGFPKQILSQRS